MRSYRGDFEDFGKEVTLLGPKTVVSFSCFQGSDQPAQQASHERRGEKPRGGYILARGRQKAAQQKPCRKYSDEATPAQGDAIGSKV